MTKTGTEGGDLWTDIPRGRGGFISGDVIYALETNRWYAIRMTVDLNTGTYKLYMDGNELASITEVEVPEKVYIDFFRLGVDAKGDTAFTTYYDDVAASLLDPTPPLQQWSLRITCSASGSTNPRGTINLNDNENLTVNARPTSGYVFSKWTFDGADYSTNSTVTIPAQSVGTQHTLHASFISGVPESNLEYNWLPLQAIGLTLIGSGGYLLWSENKLKSRNLKIRILTAHSRPSKCAL